jgi:predicted MFS family arabinose efflux permease
LRERAISNAVLFLSLAAFGGGISQRIVDPLLPRLADEFSVSLGSASWAITSFTLGYAACQLLFGPIGDRFGKFGVVAWGCAASGDAVRIRHDTASAPGGARDCRRHDRSNRSAHHGVDRRCNPLPFFIIAVLFVASAALLLSTRRSLPARALAGQPVSGHPLQRFWREFALVIAEPHVRTVLLTVFLEGATVFGAFAFFAAHVHHELGLPLTSAGMVVMLVGIGGLLFAVASRKLVGRLGESGLVALSCLSMGVGFYMFHNTLQTHATQMAPARRGTAVAAFALCFFLGQSVGVSLAGWLIGRFGSRAVLIGAAAAILLVTANFHRKIRHL